MTTNGNEERPNQSPTGWTWVHLGELADFINGDRGKNYPHRSQYVSSGIPFINAGHILANGSLSIDSMNYISQEKFESLRSGKIKKGDLIYCLRGALGKVAIINQFSEGAIASSLVIVRPNNKVNATYLFYFLISPLGKLEIEKYDNGTAQPNLSAKSLKSYLLPLPPEDEQERIVAEIEKQFTRLDQAVVSLKRLQSSLARYKASVLKAACEGRLVSQDPQDEPAADLLARILAERRAQWQAANPGKKYQEVSGVETAVLPDLPEGWVWAVMDHLADQRLGKMLDKSKNTGHFHPYLRNTNVRWFEFDLSDIKEMKVSDEEMDNISVRFGDLVVCEGGEPGRASVWEREEPFVIQKALHRVRPFDSISPWYLAFKLASDAQTGKLEKYFTGSTIQHFTGQSLRSYMVPLPPLAEQERIVAEVERRLSVIAATEQAITTNLARAERLRQSILGQAFTGQLVPQQEKLEHAS